MNYKKARAWQDILLFGGAFVAGVGVWGFDSTFLGLLGLAMVLLSILVWWLYYRCPQCSKKFKYATDLIPVFGDDFGKCPVCSAMGILEKEGARTPDDLDYTEVE